MIKSYRDEEFEISCNLSGPSNLNPTLSSKRKDCVKVHYDYDDLVPDVKLLCYQSVCAKTFNIDKTLYYCLSFLSEEYIKK